ncbi:WG repeat-containing protein [Chitinophaga sp. 180180018-2]|uniref:WG repeat-containing protein n=2 Tax=Chitinophaga TaxID=79328 RepID=UPI002DF38C79|nr:WG repeat-containing protein [Chitinophaga sp. 212800010-3]
MTHNMHLYNLADVPAIVKEKHQELLPAEADRETNYFFTMLMDWEEEFPLFFHPLFIHGITALPKENGGTEGGLYALSEKGIAALREFYDFIEAHQAVLLDDVGAFLQAKKKLFQYFDEKIKQNYFRLFSTDIYTIGEDDESYIQFVEVLKGGIEKNNTLIREAIAADDPLLLDKCLFSSAAGSIQSFRQYLNMALYDYGWALIRSSAHPSQNMLFEENELLGIKDSLGDILLPAEYDAIYEYPFYGELAVVSKDGKYGYINRRAKLVIPCSYDEAFEFFGGYARVVINGKFGAIDEDGEIVIPAIYEDASVLDGGVFAVKKENEWGIVVASGAVMLPFQPAESITPIEGGSHVYFRVETPAGDSLFFTHRFKPLSVQPDDKIAVAGGYYVITRGDKTALLDVTGEELLPFATQQFFWMAELSVFMIAINKGKGLYLPGSGWLVEPLYSNISSLHIPEEEEHREHYAVINNREKAGLFAIGEKSHWVFPVAYFNFSYLKKGFWGYSTSSANWGVAGADGTIVTEPIYNSLNGKMGWIPDAVAIGIKENEILKVREDGSARPMSAQEVLDEMEHFNSAGAINPGIDVWLKARRAAKKAIGLYHEGMEAFSEGRYEEAVRKLEQSAAGHCFEAMTDLGRLYETVDGYGDGEKAMGLYRKAAQLGEKRAVKRMKEDG